MGRICSVRDQRYVSLTPHSPHAILGLSNPHCTLSWVGPFIVKMDTISLARLPTFVWSLGHSFHLSRSHRLSYHYSRCTCLPRFRLSIPACMDTIGQQVKAGGYYVYPPLHEWEKDPGWRHPEWCKIEQWIGVKGQNFQDCGQSFWRGLRPYLDGKLASSHGHGGLGYAIIIPLSTVHNGRIFFLTSLYFIYLV